jgi:basic amino acid/polyamine antiporter, APA family
MRNLSSRPASRPAAPGRPAAYNDAVADDSAAGGPPAVPELRRVLGLTQVTAGGVGIIIGAGIYVLLGPATAQAGAAVWLAFVVAAILSVLTGLSYAELSSMFPSAAGEYEYTRHAMPEWVAFVVGWMMIVALVVAAATVSLGFGRYVGHFVDVPARAAGLVLLGLVCLVAAGGIQQSARLTVVLSAVQVGGLLLIIGIGLPHVGDVDLLAGHGAGPLLGAAALVFFAFIGFDEVITLAEETRDPTRTVPRALLLALGLSTLLYLAVAIAAVSVLGASALAASPRPLADVMAHDLGRASAGVVAVIAMISTTNTTLLAITAASRVTYGMAAKAALPARLARVHRRYRTPVPAIVVVAAVAAAFVLVGDLAFIAAVTDFAVYLVFLAVNGTVLALRWRRPDLPRPFAVPGRVAGVAVVPVLGIASVATMLAYLDTRAVLVGVTLSTLGLLAGWRLRARSGGRP